jgi:hypothetical protein
MFLEVSSVELFYFILFGRKWLQTAPEAAREALPNRIYIVSKTQLQWNHKLK